MQKFDSYQMLARLKKIADSKPVGFVYDATSGGCVNTEVTGKGEVVPSCIIGHLFVDLGIPADKLPQHGAVNALVYQTQDKFEFTKVAVAVMRTVQLMQDGGVPWRQAVKVARDVAMNGVWNPVTAQDVELDDNLYYNSDV